MEEELEKTKKVIRELNRIVSTKEWVKIARERNVLSSITLRKLYNNMTFYELCRYIRKEEKD